MNKSLAEIIRPIVEGQVRAFLHAHPEGERYPGHIISGLGKRITHDICSTQTVGRIELVLCGEVRSTKRPCKEIPEKSDLPGI